jgi:selT/selW/selH-like putative selenoprotein
MKVRILYCRPCGYRGRADALANELRVRFGADVDVVEGKLGQFDVLVDDVLVASRGKSLVTRLLPPPKSAAIVEAIESHLAMREGEHCEVPATGLKG